MTLKRVALLYLSLMPVVGVAILIGTAFLLAFHPKILAYIGALAICCGVAYAMRVIEEYLDKSYPPEEQQRE